MLCPNPECNSSCHKVFDTDGQRYGAFTVRACRCLVCGHLFSSVEYPVSQETGQKLFQEYIMPHLNSISKEREKTAYKHEPFGFVHEYNFGVRVQACLSRAGIKTMKDLTTKTESDLLKIRNFGHACLVRTRIELRKNGWDIRGGKRSKSR